ncbi:DUF2804 domain-containing protein [Massilia sp. P8910]|uniref:DUF2804 domain-containing protein n=1 Tax=Massilia antarctica TaxID=2765360 RepID=UPI0006BB95B6|nr:MULTISPECIES: DUF2804 domain-containing protein [Massilia]MCE3604093.1 DUF2804 domain-containing protein [Massilia antarctica]MCY0910511.1 DUF2804 domain-containing protein [Massilia sp. H27-R4]CUI09133.1 hypothetical protein BN2497_13043 [Janthinobacterium sp. CG23_2]CUU32919.1 hypothetical protein BN3177_13043 [Janthinobacterium sp. CG23_2]
MTSLPAAPQTIPAADGVPVFGRFAGAATRFDWARLAAPHARSRWWRRFHHKRWHYTALATDELFCGIAIVDVGWTNTAFAYVFERGQGAVVAGFSRDGIPGLTARLAGHVGEQSSFSFAGSRIAMSASTLSLRCKDVRIDAAFGAPGAPLLLAVGPVHGGAVHATQKSSGLALTGTVRVGERAYQLDGGVASFDYSNGLLARNTAWRWASAHSLELGFNVQAGYFGAHENALWLDGRLIGLGAATFEFVEGDPMAPWHVFTDDGLLDLHFTPEGARREDKNLLVAASRYVQPIGTFSGWVRASADAPRRTVACLTGVTEDHASRW